MKVIYFDCFAGASGDMVLGALLDAGAPEEALRQGLADLPLEWGWRLEIGKQPRHNILGTRVRVEAEDAPRERTFGDIRKLLKARGMKPEVRRLSLAVFERLAKAEGRIHGIHPDEVHFHEVGALDSVIDIVGAALLFDALSPDAAFCSPLPLGSGTVECRHGTFPVPAPATLEVCKGLPVVTGAAAGEMTTPTGAALLATFCGQNFGPMPPLTPKAVGYGVGSRDLAGLPNLLRVVIGEAPEGLAMGAARDEVALLETNIDDMNPQLYGPLMQALLNAGALDVWLSPVQMKKDRPGTLVSVLCRPGDDNACARILFRETTTLGVRVSLRARLICAREAAQVETPLGSIAVKLARDPWGGLRAAPEMDSVREAAARTGVALPEAYGVACEAASRLIRERAEGGESG